MTAELGREHLARPGDAAWSRRLSRHGEIVREGLLRFDGRLIKMIGDGALGTFSGPARAVSAASSILEALGSEGLEARAGIHVGEVELEGDDIAGLAVHIAARVMGEARGGEILVSRTVRDLTAGSGLEFTERGRHALKGIPDEWELYALS